MRISQLLPHVTKMLTSFKTTGGKNPSLSRLDFGILEVALMVAALDGEILESEYAAFTALARKCRGYSAENARKCADSALRRGGYLMAIAKVGGYTVRQRIEAFVDLAIETMPRGFVDGELSDLRRAFVLWVAMGVSDGDFSAIERQAIDALQDRLARVMLVRTMDEEQRWAAFVPALQMLDGRFSGTRKITLLEDGFTDRAASLVRDLGVAARRERAEAELAAFIRQD